MLAFVKPRLQHLNQVALDLLFPPRCVACERWGWLFCPHCAQEVVPTGPQICLRCGRNVDGARELCSVCQEGAPVALRFIRAAALYRGPLKAAIHALKYEGLPLLGRLLARYLIAATDTEEWDRVLNSIHAIVPIPLHPARRAERGYNQSELLAVAFADAKDLVVEPSWLTRRRHTQSQTTLSRQERRLNVAGAFQADPSVRNRRILLVDDVYTTGATMEACAQALLDAGAEAVYGLALAMPPFQEEPA